MWVVEGSRCGGIRCGLQILVLTRASWAGRPGHRYAAGKVAPALNQHFWEAFAAAAWWWGCFPAVQALHQCWLHTDCPAVHARAHAKHTTHHVTSPSDAGWSRPELTACAGMSDLQSEKDKYNIVSVICGI